MYTDRQRDAIENWLKDNDEKRVEVCREINSYNGDMEEFQTWDLEDLCSTMDTYDAVRAVIYGNVGNVMNEVRFDAYGNLQTAWDSDLYDESMSRIDDIIDFIESNGDGDLSINVDNILYEMGVWDDEEV